MRAAQLKESEKARSNECATENKNRECPDESHILVASHVSAGSCGDGPLLPVSESLPENLRR